uniref:Uncharacterized protein n=1 Tax=Rhipicephalus zambeziensis TaxID=60191 RepID=A0A224Y785_9ACAR
MQRPVFYDELVYSKQTPHRYNVLQSSIIRRNFTLTPSHTMLLQYRSRKNSLTITILPNAKFKHSCVNVLKSQYIEANNLKTTQLTKFLWHTKDFNGYEHPNGSCIP